jgi:hypothetical protein
LLLRFCLKVKDAYHEDKTEEGDSSKPLAVLAYVSILCDQSLRLLLVYFKMIVNAYSTGFLIIHHIAICKPYSMAIWLLPVWSYALYIAI